jgi:hypothetical protein
LTLYNQRRKHGNLEKVLLYTTLSRACASSRVPSEGRLFSTSLLFFSVVTEGPPSRRPTRCRFRLDSRLSQPTTNVTTVMPRHPTLPEPFLVDNPSKSLPPLVNNPSKSLPSSAPSRPHPHMHPLTLSLIVGKTPPAPHPITQRFIPHLRQSHYRATTASRVIPIYSEVFASPPAPTIPPLTSLVGWSEDKKQSTITHTLNPSLTGPSLPPQARLGVGILRPIIYTVSSIGIYLTGARSYKQQMAIPMQGTRPGEKGGPFERMQIPPGAIRHVVHNNCYRCTRTRASRRTRPYPYMCCLCHFIMQKCSSVVALPYSISYSLEVGSSKLIVGPVWVEIRFGYKLISQFRLARVCLFPESEW